MATITEQNVNKQSNSNEDATINKASSFVSHSSKNSANAVDDDDESVATGGTNDTNGSKRKRRRHRKKNTNSNKNDENQMNLPNTNTPLTSSIFKNDITKENKKSVSKSNTHVR